MGFLLKDALELEILSRFRVVAGRNGLKRQVNKVGILDHESGQTITETFVAGEFTLASLLAVKDDVEALYPLVEKLIEADTACLAVKTVYFEALPKSVIELADRHDYPIFLFDVTYFEDIIMGINAAVRERQEMDRMAMKIEYILNNDVTGFQVRNMAYEMNRRFHDRHMAFYLEQGSGDPIKASLKETLEDLFKNHFELQLVRLREGLLGILSGSALDEAAFNTCYMQLQTLFEETLDEHRLGISRLHDQIETLKETLQEALYAVEYARLNQLDNALYRDLGIERILLPLRQEPHLMHFYDQLIKPILDYDREHGTDLLLTAEVYIENQGDFKRTASALYQHGNTIRYRMDKIKKIIARQTKTSYTYEELAVAVKLHRIYSRLN